MEFSPRKCVYPLTSCACLVKAVFLTLKILQIVGFQGLESDGIKLTSQFSEQLPEQVKQMLIKIEKWVNYGVIFLFLSHCLQFLS